MWGARPRDCCAGTTPNEVLSSLQRPQWLVGTSCFKQSPPSRDYPPTVGASHQGQMRDQGLTCSSCCTVQLGLPNGPSIAIWHPQTEKMCQELHFGA